MGIIETVIILSLYVYDGGNKNIEGWYHQETSGPDAGPGGRTGLQASQEHFHPAGARQARIGQSSRPPDDHAVRARQGQAQDHPRQARCEIPRRQGC